MPDNPRPPMVDLPDDPWLIDRLLAGHDGPESAALAELLSAVASPATPSELMGEQAAVAAFLELGPGVSSPQQSTPARRFPVLSALLASKLAVVAAAGTISLGATAAAAFTGVLPAGPQNLAHHTIGAPAASVDDGAAATEDAADETDVDGAATDVTAADTADDTADDATDATPTGPDAAGPAAFGLCTAYGNGGLGTNSVAYDSLVKAVTDAAPEGTVIEPTEQATAKAIDGYCATVAAPSDKASDSAVTSEEDAAASNGASDVAASHASGAQDNVPPSHANGAPDDARPVNPSGR